MAFFPRHWLVIALLADAIVLRLVNLSYEALWIDEINSLMVATVHGYPAQLPESAQPTHWFVERLLSWQPMDWQALLGMLKQNVHMPAYYLLLNPWLGVFGTSAVALRLFSVLFSVLLLIPFYALAKRLMDKRGALIALAFAALSPFQLYFAQEGRMYTLLLFWSVLASYSLWRFFYAPGRLKPLGWSLLYTATALAGFYTHYTFFFILIFHAAFGAVATWQTRHKTNAWLALPALALATAGGLWLPVYKAQKAFEAGQWHFSDGLLRWNRYAEAIIWEPLVVVAESNPWARVLYFPLTAVLLLANALGLALKKLKFEWRRDGFLWGWVLVPMLAAVAIDLANGTHMATVERYTMVIAPGVYLLLGFAASRLLLHVPRLTVLKWPVAALMLIFAIGTVWAPSPLRYGNKYRMKAVVSYLNKNLQPGDVILVNGTLAAPATLAYYLQASHPNQPIYFWTSSYHTQANLPLPYASTLAPYQRVWFLPYGSNKHRGSKQIQRWLKTHYPHKTSAPHIGQSLALYQQK